MPPKKGTEVAPATELPDQPPEWTNEGYVDGLLLAAIADEFDIVQRGAAALLQAKHEARIDLRIGCSVDFVADAIFFAAEHRFPPRKTASFVAWLLDMRAYIIEDGDDIRARAIFKGRLLADTATAEAAAAAPPHEAPAASEVPIPAPSAPVVKKKGDKRGAKAEEVPVITRTYEQASHLSANEVPDVVSFVISGLLQHWRLHCHVAASPPQPVQSRGFAISVIPPMAAPPLMSAEPAAVYETRKSLEAGAAAAELECLRAAEASAEAGEAEAAAAEAERQRRHEEEVEATTLYFSDRGTATAVQTAEKDVALEVATRQQILIQRIAKLEDALKITPP